MIALDEVQQQPEDRSIVRTIDVVPRGHIRIMTGLLYRQPFHRDEDLERLQDFSAVIPFSEKQTLIELLAA